MEIYIIRSPGERVCEYEYSPDSPQIVLGEEGRGRACIIVPVLGPPGPGGYAVCVTQHGPVLSPTAQADSRCLAAINTVGEYDRFRSYALHDAVGVMVVVSAYRAFGAAGRTNGGPHVLAIIEPGAEFRLCSKYAHHWYRYQDGQWYLETPAERSARLALAAFEADEGEWL